MSHRCCRSAFLLLLLLSGTVAKSQAQSSAVPPKAVTAPHRLALLNSYGRLPLTFIRNVGQTDKQVQFLARTANLNLFLTPTEAVFSLTKPTTPQKNADNKRPVKQRSVIASVVRMRLRAANPHPTVSGIDTLRGKVNYFLGNDPAQWHRNVNTYAKVRYGSVYPGVDLVYYGNSRQLEYDFVVAPFANSRHIALSFVGTKRVRVEPSGELSLALKNGELRWHRPVVYQEIQGLRYAVPGRYLSLGPHTVGFDIGKYDPSLPLVIDPQLVYSTYLGGDDKLFGDNANSIAIDNQGNAYITGFTYSANFPVTKGAFQTTLKATYGNAFVTKLNPNGSALVYSTFLGGSGDGIDNGIMDSGASIAVDAHGNAYVTGMTHSSDFPVTKGAFQSGPKTKTAKSYVFVTKLNVDGSSLAYSTYLRGPSAVVGEDAGNGIAVDAPGNAYVTGSTSSIDFPVTKGAFQTSNRSYHSSDAFVTKLSVDGSALVYSSYLGGSDIDTGNAIAVDGKGNAYVTGTTSSSNFPVTKGAFQTRPAGVFLTKFSADGSALLYSSYLGGTGGDNGEGVAVDANGNAYVTGNTRSSDFPVTRGAFQTTVQATRNRANSFVTKFSVDGSALAYSTYLGGTGGSWGDFAHGIAVDIQGNAVVIGHTSSKDFPVTKGAFQTINRGAINAFLTKLNPTGSALAYSTYIGGTERSYGDYGHGVAVDAFGNAYITGQAFASDFPVTAGAFQTTLNSKGTDEGNAFVSKIHMALPTATYFSVLPGVTAAAGDTVLLKAQLNDNTTKMGIPGASLLFTLNGTKPGTASTDAHGNASLKATVPDGQTAGNAYPIQVSFDGNSNYAASTGNGTLNLVKGKTKFATAPNATGKQGAKATFTVKLIRTSDGKGTGNETVTFKVEGANIGTAQTDSTGTASLSYTIPKNAKVGAHGALVLFSGDANYNSCNVAGTLTVTK